LKKKKVLIGVFIAIFLSCLLGASVLFACQTNGIDVLSLFKKEEIKGGKYLDSYKYLVGEDEPYEYEGWAGAFFEKITYTVDNMETDGDSGTATVTVSAPDLQVIVSGIIENVLAKQGEDVEFDNGIEIIREDLKNAFASDVKMISTTFEMEIQKIADEWKLVPNAEWEKATTGNSMELFTNSFQLLLQEVDLDEMD